MKNTCGLASPGIAICQRGLPKEVPDLVVYDDDVWREKGSIAGSCLRIALATSLAQPHPPSKTARPADSRGVANHGTWVAVSIVEPVKMHHPLPIDMSQ